MTDFLKYIQSQPELDEAPFHGYVKHNRPYLLSSKEVAEMLGVTTADLKTWRDRKIFGIPLFTADEMHGGAWYYDRERVEQLKSVYHNDINQNNCQLDNRNPDTNETLPQNTPSKNFQTRNTTSEHLENEGVFYSMEEVVQILGVNEQTLRRLRDKNIFAEDKTNQYGIYLYRQDRVMEMKLLLHKYGSGTEAKNTAATGTIATGTAATTSFANVPTTEDPAAIVRKLNGSIRPSRTRIEINDKLTKVVFNLSAKEMLNLLNGNTAAIIEKRNYKRRGNILTPYKIRNADDYRVQRPFTMFDRFVLSACISEWVAGNRCITPAMIYRALVGKINRGSSARPSKDQLAAITDSLKILMGRIIEYNAQDLCEVLGYNDGKAFRVSSPLLPAAYIDASAAGSNTTAVVLLAEPPLLTIAKIKGQIISYDSNLLDIPRQQNTSMNIVLKNYCMLRVQEMLIHKQLPPVVTANDIFAKARMEDADNKIKLRARTFIKAFLAHLQNNHLIDSFELIKNQGVVTCIKFSRPENNSLKIPR